MSHFKLIAAAVSLIAGTSILHSQTLTSDAANLERARAAMSANNPKGALDQLRALRILDSPAGSSPEATLLEAQALVATGNPRGARMLSAWIDANPASPLLAEARLQLGNVMFGNSDFAEALSTYGKVAPSSLAADSRADLLFHKAYSTLALGDTATASSLLLGMPARGKYARERDFCLAYLDFCKGDYANAYPQFKRLADTFSPLGTASFFYLAQIDFSRGDYRTALTNASTVGGMPEISEEYRAQALRICGESAYNLGMNDAALKYLDSFLDAAGSDIPAATAYIIGVTRYKAADFAGAREMFQKSAGGSDAMAQSSNLYLGQCYIKSGDTNQALMAFEKAYRLKCESSLSEEALYNYAVARSNGGRMPFANSVALFENFLTLFPDSRYAPSVERYILDGYMSDNDYAGALRAVNSMKRPSAEALAVKQRALFVLGTRDYNSGKTVEALKRFEAAAAVVPGDAALRRQCSYWLGMCLYDNGAYDRAASIFQDYVRSAQGSDKAALSARYNLAYCHFNSERYPQALTEYRKVLSGNPSAEVRADVLNRIADCQYYTGKYSEAASTYAQALEANPAAGDYALFQQAQMKGLLRDNKAKIDELDRLTRSYPQSSLVPGALLEKASTLAAMGEGGESMDAYRELIRLYPSSAAARKGMLQLAITQESAGRTAEAVESFKEVIRKYPTSDEARLAADDLKRIHAAEGSLDSFARFMASVPGAPSIDPSELDALSFRAAEAEYVNKDATARLEKYLVEYPEGTHTPQALYYLADAAMSAGNETQALDYSERLLQKYPHASAAEDALLIKAEALQALGKGELALEAYTTLASRAAGTRNLTEARLGQMRTAAALGRHEAVLEAAEALENSPAATANASEIKYDMAVALEGTGNTQRARTLWAQLAGDPDNLYGSMSAVAAASSYLDEGQTDSALKTADALINANPPHQYWLARAFIIYSDALRAKGETFEADEYLRTLRENYPGNESDIFQMIDKRLDK